MNKEKNISVPESIKLAISKSCPMVQIKYNLVVSTSSKEEESCREKERKLLKSVFLKEISALDKFMTTTTLIYLPDLAHV